MDNLDFISTSKVNQNDGTSKSIDFDYLRRLGLMLLQRYSKEEWSDHNVHDPGITSLEIISYVITALGQRLNLSAEDILLSQEQPDSSFLEELFPLAEDILTTSPITLKDFRKVILGLNEIKNVYLEVSDQAEVSIYYDTQLKDIVYQTTPIHIGYRGLYNIQVEFEQSESGDLNSNIIDNLNGNKIQITIPYAGGIKSFDLSFSFQYWDELAPDWVTENVVQSVNLIQDPIGIETEASSCEENHPVDIIIEHYYMEPDLTFSGGNTISRVPVNIHISPYILASDSISDSNIKTEIQNLVNSVTGNSIFDLYRKKILEINKIIPYVRTLFHRNRNLCEDLLHIQSVKTQEIAINSVIEIKPGSDPVLVMAHIYAVIDLFLSPSISYSTLHSLLKEKDVDLDEIFEGPLLEKGFIMDEQLDDFTRQDIIYTSDLIRILMKIDGIFSVAMLNLESYIDNYKVINCELNCLRLLSKQYRPKLSLKKSKVNLTRNGEVIEFTAEMDSNVILEFNNLVNEDVPDLINPGNIPIHLDGIPFNLENIKSLQFDLPDTYGVGTASFKNHESNSKLARSKQMKAFLYFFDLIINTYNAQLKNLSKLYSLSSNVEKTYFFEPLYELPGLDELLKSFDPNSENWEDFVQDPFNSFITSLNSTFEDQASHHRRRNMFLNHLMSRIAENFEEYTLLMQSIYGHSYLAEIIFDKIQFLRSYPQLSQSRVSAFNYLAINASDNPDVWDTYNISGYEKMIHKRLGFRESKRRHLYNPLLVFFEIYDEIDSDNIPGKRFRLINQQNEILLSSSTHYPDENSAWAEINQVINCFGSLTNYKIIQAVSGKFYFNLHNDEGEIIARRIQPFNHKQAAIEAIESVMLFFHENFTMEGFHLVEHNLLRPRYDVSNQTNEDLLHHIKYNGIMLEDPYSFVITIIFPSGYVTNYNEGASRQPISGSSAKIKNPEFINYAARVIRDEAPAHSMVNIFQLDVHLGASPPQVVSLQEFESVYRQWMETIANPASSEQLKRAHQQILIKSLDTIYQHA